MILISEISIQVRYAMRDDHRQLIGIGFTVTVVAGAVLVAHNFLRPMAWAGIIAIGTWPLYLRWERTLGGRRPLAATTFALFVTLLITVPLYYLGSLLAHEIRVLSGFLIQANNVGTPAPPWLQNLPMVGAQAVSWWNDTLGQPRGLAEYFDPESLTSLEGMGKLFTGIGAQVLHRLVHLAFALLTLFFCYLNGESVVHQIEAIGNYCLGKRWEVYSARIPVSIRATVDGLVLVGLVEGLLLGIGYAVAGVPSVVLLGTVSALLAIIPFGAPVAFGGVAIYLLAQGHTAGALGIAIWGFLILFIADHFVRPAMIGGATKLPFLAVLFGILGGVELLGLLGLFVGPIVMVFFVTLWREPDLFGKELLPNTPSADPPLRSA